MENLIFCERMVQHIHLLLDFNSMCFVFFKKTVFSKLVVTYEL